MAGQVIKIKKRNVYRRKTIEGFKAIASKFKRWFGIEPVPPPQTTRLRIQILNESPNGQEKKSRISVAPGPQMCPFCRDILSDSDGREKVHCQRVAAHLVHRNCAQYLYMRCPLCKGQLK